MSLPASLGEPTAFRDSSRRSQTSDKTGNADSAPAVKAWASLPAAAGGNAAVRRSTEDAQHLREGASHEMQMPL